MYVEGIRGVPLEWVDEGEREYTREEGMHKAQLEAEMERQGGAPSQPSQGDTTRQSASGEATKGRPKKK